MKKVVLVLLFGLSEIGLHAQSLQDLQKTSDDIDPEAEAAYLRHDVHLEFDYSENTGFSLKKNYHDIIKIYKDQGKSLGDITIVLYNNSSEKERLIKKKVVVYNLQNGKIISSELEKSDIFENRVSDNYKLITAGSPEVKTGSIIDIEYTIESPFFYTLPRFYFQESIPVHSATFLATVPLYFIYAPIPRGSIPFEFKEETIQRGGLRFTKNTLSASNIPALKSDDYVLNIDDYRSSIKYEIKAVDRGSGGIKYFSSDWDEIAKDFMKSSYFLNRMNTNFKGKDDLINQIKELNEEERIQKVYDYVRTNYTWNGDYITHESTNADGLLKNGSGGVGAINMLLINLLNEAHIPARPMLLKSRDNGLLNLLYPNITDIDYLIAYVTMGNTQFLLDATDKLVPVGQLPLRAININGILLNMDKALLQEFKNPNSFTKQSMSNLTIDLENNRLIGNKKVKLEDYAATIYRQENSSLTSDIKIDESSEEEPDFIDTSLKTSISNLEDIYAPILLESQLTLYSSIKQIDDNIFIDATVGIPYTMNTFQEETRHFPVFFDSRHKEKYIVNLEMPEGYMASYLPQNINIAMPNNKASFKYEIKQQKGKLLIYFFLDINEDLFFTEEYTSLKTFFETVNSVSREKIQLNKI